LKPWAIEKNLRWAIEKEYEGVEKENKKNINKDFNRLK
jgi:hypothetical protein